MSDLKNNAIESLTFVGLISGIGYFSKKVLKKTLTGDPSNSLMNALEFSAVMLGAIYARDYLVKEKIIPT